MIGNGLVVRLKKGKYRINQFDAELMAGRERAGTGRRMV
jgi:hypothetical protein